jgi:membrane fusion protein (multidrug efflux system)
MKRTRRELHRIIRAFRLPAWAMLVIMIAGGLLNGCEEAESETPNGMPPPAVSVIAVQPRDLPATFEYVGQIDGVRDVEVRPRISGILERWNYKEGAPVKAGESLFTIDPEPFRAALAKADADRARAEAILAQARRDTGRLKPLWEAKAVSQKAYDDAVSSEQVAAANVEAAQAAVTQARLDLSYTRVEAPISGISGRALKSEGSLVEAQQTLLTTISQIDPIHVLFSFSDTEYLGFTRAVAEGRLKLPKDGRFDVRLKLSDGHEYSHVGKVDFTDVRVNASTGTIEARAVIPNPQHLLRPGQFVRVLLSGAVRPGAIAVPQRAVLEGPNTKIVMTVNDKGVVEPRPVQVGDWSGEEWVITGGLHPGDRVIIDGVVKARPGSPVTIVKDDTGQPHPSDQAPQTDPSPRAKQAGRTGDGAARVAER